jgi:hypothetical protein
MSGIKSCPEHPHEDMGWKRRARLAGLSSRNRANARVSVILSEGERPSRRIPAMSGSILRLDFQNGTPIPGLHYLESQWHAVYRRYQQWMRECGSTRPDPSSFLKKNTAAPVWYTVRNLTAYSEPPAEKAIEGLERRSKKVALIERQNPRWEDLYAYMGKRIAASEEFARGDQASAASGSFDSGVRPRSG